MAIAMWIPVDPVSISDTPARRVIAPELTSTSRLSERVMTILVGVAFWLVMCGSVADGVRAGMNDDLSYSRS